MYIPSIDLKLAGMKCCLITKYGKILVAMYEEEKEVNYL